MLCRCLAVLALAAGALFAQSSAIQGVLVDAQGARIPGASIAAVDEVKGVVARRAATMENGSFHLGPLLSGRYTVKAEMAGFAPLERRGLVLDTNQVMNLGTLQLELGATTQSVTVEAEVPVVETATAQKSFVLASRQITEHSLNGRDFTSLMKTLPGVTSNAQSEFRMAFNQSDTFNVNGLRSSMNNIFLDGTVNTDTGDNGGQYTQLSLDAVGEFKLQNGTFNAEYGRNAGVMISATTKSGGSTFHGTLYEFLRNDALDARPPFDTTGRKTKLRFNQFGGNLSGPLYLPGVSTRTDKRLFFFFNYEGTRGTRPSGPQFVDVPHQDLLEGDFRRMLRSTAIRTAPQFAAGTVFQPGTITRDNAGNVTGGVPFPNNTVPRSQWNRNAAAFLSILNRADRASAQAVPNSPELVRVPLSNSYSLRKNQEVARIDYAISAKTSAFFRWVDDWQYESDGLGIWTTNPFPIYPMYHTKPGSSWSWNVINTISPSIVNEAIFAYTHQTQVLDVREGTDPATYDRDKLGFQYKQMFPEVNLRNRFPRFNCGVGSCNLSGFASNWLNDGKNYAWTDNLTIARSAHTFKTGVLFQIDDKQQQPTWNDAGMINFTPNNNNPNDSSNGLANLLLGNFTNYQQSNGVFYGSFRYLNLEFYGQDSWRVNSRLVLEFGARYAYLGPTYTRGSFLTSYFDPALYDPAKAVRIDTAKGLLQGSIVPGSGDPFNGMVQENTPGVPSGFGRHRKNQVAPRFGFAYDPWGNGKTAVRAGFGVFFERIRQSNVFGMLGNPPLSYTPQVFASNLDQLSTYVPDDSTRRFPVALNTLDPVNKTPTIYSWSFGIQRKLPKEMALDVAWVGNVARHLLYVKDINQLPLGTTVRTTILKDANNVNNAIRPYLGYQSINVIENAANSNYNSLQARLSRRFGRSLTGNVNYTWSKAIDEADGDRDALGYYLDRRRDRGLAGFDRAHVLTLDYVYELPDGKRLPNAVLRQALGGWQISGITRFSSGAPLTLSSTGQPGTLGSGVRPDYIGGDLKPRTRTRDEYFNPLVFARPLDGTLGNTGRSILRGPGINNWDISLFKQVRLGETVRVQFRLETFNTFNHTQWFGVNTALSTPNAGAAITADTRGTSGQVTTTRDPRNVQLGLKLYF